MENRTKFNLEKNIKQWKLSLANNHINKVNIVELESHLLDSIQELKSKGLTEEESYIVSRKRIGKIDDITLEFNKVNSNFSIINKTVPYLKGILIYMSFIIFGRLLLLSSLLIGDILNVSDSTFNIINIVLLITFSTSVFISIYYSIKTKASFLFKLNKINVLVPIVFMLLIISTFLTTLPFGGINLTNGLNDYNISVERYGVMVMTSSIFKAIWFIILITIALMLFFKNKKHNKLKFVE